MVAEWSHPESALDGGGFHADFFHWFPAYSDLLQKESWRILNGYSEGHSYFDAEGKGSMTAFLETYLDQYRKTVGKGYINLPLGNHDLSRLNIRRSTDDLEIIYAFSLTMPGVPFIFYGNEIGMRQLYGLPHVEGAYQPRAGGRTPMQWNSGKNRGFSKADPDRLYLPVDTAADAPNVADQQDDAWSLLNRVRRLIRLKKSEAALTAYAEFVPVYAQPGTYPFVYARANGDAIVLVLLNPAAREATAKFSLRPIAADHELLAGTAPRMEYADGEYDVAMAGQSYAIYRLVK
jgi:maltose alpha-D-glucosyltransferase/alpha-amylase